MDELLYLVAHTQSLNKKVKTLKLVRGKISQEVGINEL
jgi:hypothetical protein